MKQAGPLPRSIAMSDPQNDTPAHTPWLSLIFGYGPAAVLPILGIAALSGFERALALGQLWGAAILIFLAGVTRGLSFFTAGGPRLSQLGVMLLRFLAGLAALVAAPTVAFVLLLVGYASIAFYDPRAAQSGAAPRFFAQLRPPQSLVFAAGLALLLIASVQG